MICEHAWYASKRPGSRERASTAALTRRCTAGARASGTDGKQVWKLHDVRYLAIAVKPISPRLLRVVVDARPFRLHVVSGHAPIEAAPAQDKVAFWYVLLLDLTPVAADPLNVIFPGIDPNARHGSVVNEYSGGSEADDEIPNGMALRVLATELKLRATNAL